MEEPFYTVSHLVEGKRWYYGLVREKSELLELEKELVGMEWEEKRYRDIRGS